jgi:hypothetical protein
MKLSKKHARDFTVSFIHGTANTVTGYLNSGERQEIQWLYLLAGNVKIEYTMNGYEGNYDIFVDVLADLRPIKGIDTKWTAGAEDFYAVTFAASDESIYEADIITVTTEKKLDIDDNEKIIIPLIPGITINDISINQLSSARIAAGNSVKINATYADSPIFCFYKK